MIPDRSRLAIVGLALAAPAVARAHLVNSGLGPFYDGVSHFALTPEDVLPALALALLAGQRGVVTGRAVVFSLPGAWLLGGLAGLAWPSTALAPVLHIGSLVAVGGLVAAEARVRLALMVSLSVGLGCAHGYLNGSVMAHTRLGALGLAGIVSALFVLVTLSAALVVGTRVPWGRIAVRVAGSWIAAIGLLAFGWSIRRR